MKASIKILSLVLVPFFFAYTAYAQCCNFRVQLDNALQKGAPLNGTLYILMSRNNEEAPVFSAGYSITEPVFSYGLHEWDGKRAVLLNASVMAHFPDKVPPGQYLVQAVLDTNTTARSFAVARGNLYSEPLARSISPGSDDTLTLTLSHAFPEHTSLQSDTVKELHVDSRLLEDFYHQPVPINATVILPRSYGSDNTRKYPVVYVIPGFGEPYYHYKWVLRGMAHVDKAEKIYVILDAECKLGHHVFADSDNNGPRAQALVTEFIPYVDSLYRTSGKRFLFGHSSGAWSALWLQLHYPTLFGGAWCTAPDPVDFSNFFHVDLYEKGANMFYDKAGHARTLDRLPDLPAIPYKALSDREQVIGAGEQYGSFESVFSRSDKNGWPGRLWNRQTGDIAPTVVKDWSRYDICRFIIDNQHTLLPDIKGKLHIYVGEKDNYYLESSVKTMEQAIKNIPLDLRIDYLKDEDHYTILNEDVFRKIIFEMNTQLVKIK